MFHLVLVLFLLLSCVNCSPHKCGPHDLCSCYNNIMDCSKQNVGICSVCETIGNLTYLDISCNNITDLHQDCLTKCRGLETLILRDNSIQNISDSFKGMDNLKYLDLSANSLDIYEKGGHYSLNHLSNLSVLKLQNNLNRSLANNFSYPSIGHLQSLDILYIDGITNTKFDHSYMHLRKLFMSGFSGVCDLQLITNHTFENLDQLKVLDLSRCNITNINEDSFIRLHRLQYLNLSHNQQLGFEILRNVSYSLRFTNIKSLNMSKVYNTFGVGTTLRKRDVCYLRNTTLEEIVLDSNRIVLIETNVFQLFPPTIKIVHVNDNKFTCGPYLLQFNCVPNVTKVYASFQNNYHDPRLYLHENQNKGAFVENITDDCPFMTDDNLKNISDTMKHCPFINSSIHTYKGVGFPKTLKTLVYRDCYMKYSLDHLALSPFDNEIEHIDLSGNVLYTWHGPVGPFAHLKHLDLSRNYCSNISKQFFQFCDKIENLQIQHNFLGWMLSENNSEGIFNDLCNLKILNLSNNHITSLAHGIFSTLHSLVTLDLSYNDIGEWTVDCGQMVNLSYLNLSSNALRTLPIFLQLHFDSLSSRNITFEINYKGNVVGSSCGHIGFMHWIHDHKDSFIGYQQYLFTDINDKRISEAEFETLVDKIDKYCATYVTEIVVGVFALSVFISVTIGGLVYRNRWKLRYLLYMSKNRFFGYKRLETEVVENYKYDAFISYAEENIRFILDGIIPKLDGLSLCIHQRDFIAGNAIADNIIDAIQSSRRTVVILSKAFLKSKWCLYEFNMARMESIYTRPGQRTLIVVMLEEVAIKDMPHEMSHWIMTESYLEYTDNRHGQTLFWNHLSHALDTAGLNGNIYTVQNNGNNKWWAVDSDGSISGHQQPDDETARFMFFAQVDGSYKIVSCAATDTVHDGTSEGNSPVEGLYVSASDQGHVFFNVMPEGANYRIYTVATGKLVRMDSTLKVTSKFDIDDNRSLYKLTLRTTCLGTIFVICCENEHTLGFLDLKRTTGCT